MKHMFDIQFFADEFLTLMDLKNRMEPGDAAIASVAEVISQENEILTDVPWARGNLITGDVHFRRSAKPSAYVRKINEGIPATTSKTEAHTDTCVELSSRGIVDMSELKLAPDPAKYLLSENKPHIAMLGEHFVTELFYGSDAGGILGFAPRYGKLTSGVTKDQVVNAGGTGSNLGSVFCIKWDSEEVTGIYPKNANAGLEVIARSNVDARDSDGKEFLAHKTDYKWMVGLKIRDYRYVTRVCNIDMDATSSDETARQKLFEHLIIAKNKIHQVTKGRVVFYVSPDLFSQLEIAAFNKSNMALGYRDVNTDTRVLTFSGIPIKRNDAQAVPEKKVI